MLTHSRLIELLSYDPQTGNFVWRADAGRFGRIRAGSVAGYTNNKGYRVLVIDRKNYSAHRAAWLYVTGSLPTKQIDHKNRIKSDNRFENLREANESQNGGNVGLRRDNTSGYRGAYYNKRLNKFQARLDEKSLGYFATAKAAGEAALRARIAQYGEYAA